MGNERKNPSDSDLSQFTLSVNQIGQDELHRLDEVWVDTDSRPDAQKSLGDYQQQLEAKRKRRKQRF